MLLDFKRNQILLFEDSGESILNIQDSTDFVLCYRLRKDHYEVPYVALPKIIQAVKRAGYPLRFSPVLVQQHNADKRTRAILEAIKGGRAARGPAIEKINTFIEAAQARYGFKLTPGQAKTVLYGILGKRIVIANEIGTGKTLTVNTIGRFLLDRGIIKKILILVPASSVNNFYNDYCNFYGKQGIVKLRKEPKAKRKTVYREFRTRDNLQILITNYEKCNFDYEEMKQLRPDMVVVDEFHMMKNFLTADRSKNFFAMMKDDWNVSYRFPMSGTPIENRLFDLYPVFKFLDGGTMLGGQTFFENNFIEFETKYFKVQYMGQWITKQEIKPKGFKNMEYLKNLIRPLVIREKLSLPVGKYIREVEIEPSKKLLEAYDSAKRKANNPSAKYHAARQFLCDTTREEFEDNPKITELENIYQQTTGKILIFSFYKCTVRMLKKYFDDRGIKCLTVMGGDGEDPTVTIKKFRESPDIQFLCATDRINAAQNIQCAKFIINWEKPLKPTVLDQRIGRVYRTGCDHDVHIVNFTVLDTVEEVISNNFASKQAVIDAAIEKLDQRALDSVNKEIEAAVMKEFGGGSLSED